MNEQQFGNKIRQLLNQRSDLDTLKLERLRAARDKAIARHQAMQRAPVYAWASDVLGHFGGLSGASFKLLLPIAVLVIGLVAIYGWQQNVRLAELEEVDAQLLSDDLPIDAYLDRGFQNWLKKRAAE